MSWIIVDTITWNSMQTAIARIDANVTLIRSQLTALKKEEDHIMAAIDDLATAVAAEDTTIASAVALLQGLSAALAAAGTDPVKLAALQTDVTTQTAALAAAVVANTPGAPPPAAALAQAKAAL